MWSRGPETPRPIFPPRSEPCPKGQWNIPHPAFPLLGPKDMCRNIKPLFNFDPPATDAEIRDASLQFVRKISGFSKPSRANEAAVNRAVTEVAAAAQHLLDSLV